MESRRIRLMLVAYLRGLLKPDYPNGLRSVIRENVVVEALSRELGADQLIDSISIQASFAPLLQPKNANALLKQQFELLSLAHSRYEHNTKKTITAKADVSGIERMVEVYKQLEKQGIVGIKK